MSARGQPRCVLLRIGKAFRDSNKNKQACRRSENPIADNGHWHFFPIGLFICIRRFWKANSSLREGWIEGQPRSGSSRSVPERTLKFALAGTRGLGIQPRQIRSLSGLKAQPIGIPNQPSEARKAELPAMKSMVWASLFSTEAQNAREIEGRTRSSCRGAELLPLPIASPAILPHP